MQQQAHGALASACDRRGGPILDHMSTADVARDMDVLRQAVGSTMNYLGFSYGSFLGQVYADRFPHRVRALVIDGVLDPVAWSAGRGQEAATLPWCSDCGTSRFHLGPRQPRASPRLTSLLLRWVRSTRRSAGRIWLLPGRNRGAVTGGERGAFPGRIADEAGEGCVASAALSEFHSRATPPSRAPTASTPVPLPHGRGRRTPQNATTATWPALDVGFEHLSALAGRRRSGPLPRPLRGPHRLAGTRRRELLRPCHPLPGCGHRLPPVAPFAAALRRRVGAHGVSLAGELLHRQHRDAVPAHHPDSARGHGLPPAGVPVRTNRRGRTRTGARRPRHGLPPPSCPSCAERPITTRSARTRLLAHLGGFLGAEVRSWGALVPPTGRLTRRCGARRHHCRGRDPGATRTPTCAGHRRRRCRLHRSTHAALHRVGARRRWFQNVVTFDPANPTVVLPAPT